LSYDALVLGAGGIGSAALWALASRGLRVAGVDRHRPPHAWGSSHGDTRLIRLAYFESPHYVPLLRRSYELWEELERSAEEELYVECGLLEVGPPTGTLISGLDRAAREHSLELQRVPRDAFSARFPGFRLPQGSEARFETRAGLLRVEACISACLRLAEAAGAEVLLEEAATWERLGPHRIAVRVGERELITRSLIVTAGPWAREVLGDVGAGLTLSRQPLLWFAADEAYALRAGSPCYLYETHRGTYYGFPAEEGAGKVARHGDGETLLDPRHLDRALRPADEADVRAFLSEHLPGAAGVRVRHATCMYTLTPDGQFLVDRHPRAPEVVFAAGLSGHGYKMASALGEALADLALGDRPRVDVGFLGLGRF
jgi:sarcosine oxidase